MWVNSTHEFKGTTAIRDVTEVAVHGRKDERRRTTMLNISVVTVSEQEMTILALILIYHESSRTRRRRRPAQVVTPTPIPGSPPFVCPYF
eukprot:287347-Pleurochrysis_carterae.AAC.1